jgi:hypothetical protein
MGSSLIGLDLPLTTLVDIVGKRKKLLTYTQETIREKLERLRSTRLTHGDQKTISHDYKVVTNILKVIIQQKVKFKHFYVWTRRASITHIRWCHGDSNQ